jgi:hypothetical protein
MPMTEESNIYNFVNRLNDVKKYSFVEILSEKDLEVRQIEIPPNFTIETIIRGDTVTNYLFCTVVRDIVCAFKIHKNVYVFMNNVYALVYGALYVEFMHNGNTNKTSISDISISLIPHSDINIYVYKLCLQIITSIIKETYVDRDDELINSIIKSVMHVHTHVVESSSTKNICFIPICPEYDWTSYMYTICNEDSVPLAGYFIATNMLTTASIGNPGTNIALTRIH